LGIDGNAKLLAYVGHNGLPEFSIPSEFKNTDNKKRDCIILACKSKEYFLPILKSTKANPLLWTTFRMSPEAYTLHDAIRAYIKGQPSDSIAGKAAYAYAKYQKCSFKAARGLLVCGW